MCVYEYLAACSSSTLYFLGSGNYLKLDIVEGMTVQ